MLRKNNLFFIKIFSWSLIFHMLVFSVFLTVYSRISFNRPMLTELEFILPLPVAIPPHVCVLDARSDFCNGVKMTASEFQDACKMQVYLESLKRAMFKSWNPEALTCVPHMVVGFKLNSKGAVTKSYIVESSGNAIWDRAALGAAENFSKWNIPPSCISKEIEVCIVLPHERSNGIGILRHCDTWVLE